MLSWPKLSERWWALMPDLFDIAKAIQTAVEAQFTEAHVDLPARRYVANGSVAYDCAQFTVEISNIGIGTPSQEYGGTPRQGEIMVATIQVALIRDCAPTVDEGGDPPSVEVLETHAAIVLQDAQILGRTFLKIKKLAGCSKLKVVQCTPHGPQGALAGWVLVLRASVI
jgi:hypothetical protein